MKKRTFEVTIVGISPYMQHRMIDEKLETYEKGEGPVVRSKAPSLTMEHRAEMHSFHYDDAAGRRHYYMPSDHIKQCLIGGGGYMKSNMGNSRRSLSNIIAAMFRITPMQIELPKYDTIDSRSAVNPNTHNRVMTYRPQWTNWRVSFNLTVWEDTLTIEQIHKVFDYAGFCLGVGSYRPQHKGEFGMFELESLIETTPDAKKEGIRTEPQPEIKRRGRKPKTCTVGC